MCGAAAILCAFSPMAFAFMLRDVWLTVFLPLTFEAGKHSRMCRRSCPEPAVLPYSRNRKKLSGMRLMICVHRIFRRRNVCDARE
jgi:hypothetical protein